MPPSGNADVRPGTMDAKSRADLIFAGPRNEFPDCMIRAIRSELGKIEVLRVETLAELLAPGAETAGVRLLLVHERQCADCIAGLARLQTAMPDAAVAIVCAPAVNDPASVRTLLGSNAVLGILPLHLKLDVWLSALRLLLSGGDYCPLEYAHLLIQDGAPNRTSEPPVANGYRHSRLGAAVLTERETDVLRLVAQGMQNKNIASQLALSEHTVKLHIHHIISKLGVNNRTEATAVFLNGNDT